MSIKPILRPYISIADMLADTFGDTCEVVLHDLDDPEHSVVYVANDKVTGRKKGQNFEHLISKVIMSEELKNDYVANYYFTTSDHRLIRSSSLLIRNEEGGLEGALCINLDTTPFTQQIEFLKTFV